VQRLIVTYAVCAIASGFGMRLMDPLILPVGIEYALEPATAALLNTGFAWPYALGQPFLGPLGDRYGKLQCIRVSVAVLALAQAAGAMASSFETLVASRVLAGIFAGGVIPLVLAGLGDAYGMADRQVAIGRMLLAIIGGQMLGSTVAGLASDVFGWRSALWIAAGLAMAAAALAWVPTGTRPSSAPGSAARPSSARAMYGEVLRNPKARWLYGAVIAEGTLVSGVFPFVGPLLVEQGVSAPADAAVRAGLILGAFGAGGLAYALLVRRIVRALGVRRMCLLGSTILATTLVLLGFLPLWGLVAAAMAVAGWGFNMLHNSLQTEATEIAPGARGSAVALFACGLFVGIGLGPLWFGAVADVAGFRTALVVAAAGLLLLGQLVVRRVVVKLAPARDADPR